MTDTEALELVQDTWESLKRTGMLQTEELASMETILLGSGSALDSLSFVAFITKLETLLIQKLEDENFAVLLNDLHDFNAGESQLNVGTFTRYIHAITKKY